MTPAEAQNLLKQAEQVLGMDGESLKRMALLAWENRHNAEALGIMSVAWQRSARWLAQAVVSFPRHFMKYADTPERVPQADELLSLFMIAQRPKAERIALYDEMQRKHLTPLQVRGRIHELQEKESARHGRTAQIRLAGAKIIRATPTELRIKFSTPKITPADWEGAIIMAGSIRAKTQMGGT